MAVDKSGTVYFSDASRAAVMRIDASGRLQRVAGMGWSGTSVDGHPAKDSPLNDPYSIAFDPEGQLYIAERVAARIRKVSDGTISTVAGGDPVPIFPAPLRRPAVGALIGLPYSLALDASGRLYFSNSAGVSMVEHGIHRTLVNNRAAVTGPGMTFGEQLRISLTSRIAVDQSGSVYITQSSPQHRVYRITNGVVTPFAGSGPSGLPAEGGSALTSPLNSPSALAFDQEGSLFVAQTGLVSKIKNGVITNVAGTGVSGFGGDGGPALAAQIGRPTGIHVDGWGRLWIADDDNRRLRVVADGVIRTVAGGDYADLDSVPSMGANASFSDAVTAPNGRIYFRDYARNSIYTIEDGIIRRVAGTGSAGYNGDDQEARNAQLNVPRKIAIGPEGDLLIADERNLRVRRVRNGVITTVAGNGQYGTPVAGVAATSSPINWVNDVAAGRNGEFYFRVRYDNKIWKVGPDGLLRHFAGGGTTRPSDGLPLTDADLASAIGIHVDASGDLYVLCGSLGTTGGGIFRAQDGRLNVVAGGGGTYGGAGALATDTYLMNPMHLQFDSAGRGFFGDGVQLMTIENGRVWRLAGNGAPPRGDAGSASTLGLGAVIGLAMRGDGAMYLADGYGRLRLLSPEGERCTYSASPDRIVLPATGEPAAVRVDTQPECPWSINNQTNISSNTVVHLTIDANQYGAGSGVATVHAPPNIGPQKSATLVVAGIEIPVTQLAPPCTYKPDIPGYSFSSSPDRATFSLRAPSICSWKFEGESSWARLRVSYFSGSGPEYTGTQELELTVDANPGPARSAVFNIAGNPFTVTQAASTRPSGGTSGRLAHLASGGSWDTTITLVNIGTAPARVWFSPTWVSPQGQGRPAMRDALKPGSPPMTIGTLERELQPGESFFLETVTLPDDPLSVGSAAIESNGSIDGFAVFRQTIEGRVQEAVVPLARASGTDHAIWFDNTAGYDTGLAYVRTAEQSRPLDIQVVGPRGNIMARGDFGHAFNWGRSSLPLAWMIDEAFQQRGTLRVSGAPAGTMSLLGLRFHPQGAFTTMPAMNAQPGDGAMAHIASGGSWATTMTLVNLGSTPAQARLRVYSTQGQPLVLPWTSTLLPDAPPVVDSVLEKTMEPGEAWLLETTAPEWEPIKTGWVKLETTASVNSFAVFRQTIGSRVQEAVVPLEKSTGKASALVFDNSNGYITGIALANRDSSPSEVAVTVRDDRGLVLTSEKINLPARGQMSFTAPERWSFTTGRRGTIEFSSAVTGGLGVLGLRFHPGGAFTSIPAMAK